MREPSGPAPSKESAKPHWQAAVRVLMMSVERGGILWLAEVALLQAIHHGGDPRFDVNWKLEHIDYGPVAPKLQGAPRTSRR